jgi:hypothetical protein
MLRTHYEENKMEWIAENWDLIAMIIVSAWAILQYVAKRLKNKELQRVLGELDDFMKLATDKDAVLKQTFRNVEDLKKMWYESGLDKKYDKIGQIFKEANEDVGMEELVRKMYIALLGKEVDIAE